MSIKSRLQLERKLFNIRYDMDCIGDESEMWQEIQKMSEEELTTILKELLSEA